MRHRIQLNLFLLISIYCIPNTPLFCSIKLHQRTIFSKKGSNDTDEILAQNESKLQQVYERTSSFKFQYQFFIFSNFFYIIFCIDFRSIFLLEFFPGWKIQRRYWRDEAHIPFHILWYKEDGAQKFSFRPDWPLKMSSTRSSLGTRPLANFSEEWDKRKSVGGKIVTIMAEIGGRSDINSSRVDISLNCILRSPFSHPQLHPPTFILSPKITSSQFL